MLTASLLLALAPAALGGDGVALKAGTIHLVEGGQVLEGGATVLVEDGKIVAVGKNVTVPRGVRVVDYGPDAVLVPGLVAGDSSYGRPVPSERTADPELMAVDHVDPYQDLYSALAQGVTATYVAPARGRLIAGQGAVVKTWGEPGDGRVLSTSTGLHGSISAEARRTPGYWEPPVPATVDVGLGVEDPQLPRSTMGAVVALDELVALARDGSHADHYGSEAGPVLAQLIDAARPWRMGAEEAGEVRALLEFFDRKGLPLVLDGGRGMPGAVDLAEAIAAAKVPVLLGPPRRGEDFGKGADAPWPVYDVAAHLLEAGVRVALTPGPTEHPRSLRMAAQLLSRGGVDLEAALRAITLTPAEVLGVADRVGSIAPGKDADFAVLSAHPLASEATVLATWIGGEVAWKVDEDGPVVIEVEELHVGDGEVLRPGQLLVRDGRIVEVGSTVAHPPGSTVVRGFAAMPGMIDAYGHLGLEGSGKSFSTRTDLTRLVEPGDLADRRVARAGITTVNLGSRSDPGKKGAPTLAYRPAASDFDQLVVAHPCALHLQWSDSIRVRAGEDVREVLAEAAEYRQKWEDYEKELAAWTPPAPEKEEAGKEEDEDDEKESEEDSDDDKKKDDKKKDKDAPPVVTGVWVGELSAPDAGEDAGGTFLRLRLLDQEGTLEGNLRCEALSSTLVEVTGTRTDTSVTLTGLGTGGRIQLTLELDDEELEGSASQGGVEYPVEVERTAKEYVVARRSVKEKAEAPEEPKGKPRSPGINPDLEPLRQAMMGKGAIFVSVGRSDEVLECVEAFAKYGIEPVLVGASGAGAVAGRIRDHIRGVLPSMESIVSASDSTVDPPRNRFLELQAAGIPIALRSMAEEGAVEMPLQAALAVSAGMSRGGAVRALTFDAARILGIEDRVGRLAPGLAGDVLLLDGPPLSLSTQVTRVWVAGEEVR